MKTTIITMAAALFCATSAAATPQVSLLTFYPGSDIYELEGHTALRVADPAAGIDYAFNWGTFDFNSPNFVYRFVKGETDYTLTCAPTQPYVDRYRLSGRRVVEQLLDLDSIQTIRLLSLIDSNMLPGNRVYRYNYVLDNCATRPLALIEQAVGDTLSLATATNIAGDTFRQLMTVYHTNYPWYQFGIDLALGSGIDRPVSNRMKAFAPVALRQMLTDAVTADGHPIVSLERTLSPGADQGIVLPPTPLLLSPEFWCWIIFAITAALCLTQRAWRWVYSLLFSLYGIEGLLLTFLIFVSVHEATSPNWLYLWINPLCLLAAVGIWIKSWRKAVVWWQIVNFALVIALMVLDVCRVQTLNTAFWPLIFSDLLLSAKYIAATAKCISSKKQA